MTKTWKPFPSALVAGATAIAANTLALKAADLVPLATARGGLLRLIRPFLPAGIENLARTSAFPTLFHLFVGMLIALAYAYAIEPCLKGSALRKGLLYAFALWLLNAAVVLPLTGEGFAGAAHLTLAGMLWFAAAHTLFFVWLSIMYGRLRSTSGLP